MRGLFPFLPLHRVRKMSKALSLVCKDCGAQLRSVQEAQDHGEATGHAAFEESTAAVLTLKCTACGKPCRNQTEKEMHSRATGHNEFVDQTADNPGVETELEMQQASDSMKEALRGDNPAETRSMDASREELSQLVPANVDMSLRQQLEDMGFDANKATRALHFGGSSIEAAINWIDQHGDDPEVNEPLLVKPEEKKPQLTPEEAAKAAEELRLKAKQKRQKEEAELEKLREQERIRSGKEMAAAKRQEEDLRLKRNLELRRIEKEEEERARARIRAKLDDDRRERRRKLGLPEELSEEEKAAEAAKQAEKAAAAKKSTFTAVKPVSVASKMRDALVTIKKSSPGNDAGVTTCFQTMMKLVGNVATNPQAEKFRSIKLTNPAIQQRVVSFNGAVDFLELAGFKKQGDGSLLTMGEPDMAILNSAGGEINSALSNPMFGVL